jgi:hypothetical protein
MSADTGIYIAKFPEGYRVTEVVQCIENVYYYNPGTKRRKKELEAYFGNSEVYPTRELASSKAWKIYDEYNREEEDSGMGCPIEYGISYIGEYESFE